MDKAKEVWNHLRKRFYQRDPHRIFSFQTEIYALKQGNMTVNDYYKKCRILWEQMNELRPLPICKCDPRCACDLLDEIRSEREVNQIIRLLQGLSEDYNSLKSGVLILDPLPDMHIVFVMVEKFEMQLNITNLSLSGLEATHANAVSSNSNTADEAIAAAINQYNVRKNFTQNTVNRAKCTFGGMNSHTVEKCYKKHGYPPGWIPAVSLVPKFSKEISPKQGKCSTTHINSIALHSSNWILDSGATDHTVCSLEFFENYHAIENTAVNLPNGKQAQVDHMGDIRFADGIYLRNALRIPSFSFNIISVSGLLHNSPYVLTFTSNQCLLRGSHGKTIGFAKEEKGLYLLLESPEICSNQSCNILLCSVLPKFGTNDWGISH
ncbi:PREDICTED: uncharacterized protein LOC109174843 [Ipomoea nil]|uniref:uncharacterized protein LOC109174843 n=1 Tax=Ipomoea nil TaxID=35883 RepID=UPI0009015640|nr:PREDICTED: uncharacterized protein LOC109174843 [Ipomoea nil]